MNCSYMYDYIINDKVLDLLFGHLVVSGKIYRVKAYLNEGR